jgi:DNA repair exonuclease SbcCD ATPase subunit
MQRGMSLSEYLRMLIVQHLSQLGKQSQPEHPSNTPSTNNDPTKPIHLLELKELEASLDVLEEKVIKLEQKVQMHASLGAYGQAPAVKYEEIEQLRKTWHEKKRWFYSFYKYLDPQDVAPVVQRLVKLKERMENAYSEYLRLQRNRGTVRKNNVRDNMIVPTTR